jgi:GTP-binding protein HflX
MQERAFLVGLDHGQGGLMTAQESLRELARLVRTAGAVVVGQALQRRPHPDPSTYVGSGKLDEVREARERTGYTLVVFDEQLSPAQQLRLESALEVKVLDRSALILDIFASRARTREASLQVDLAQHEYLLPRLRGQWQHLERMEGAVGLRGPGETQLETDRRLIGQRISRLKREIEAVRRQRALHRRRRQREGVPVVALVGYTNAGKSSLLRALAGADVLAADTLFATLDPLTRRVGLPGGETVLLTDTVGFIQKLPTQLISAFRATLEELESADLLLHVVDATSPAIEAQWTTVMETLDNLGLAEKPMLTVLNKADGLVLDDGQSVDDEAELTRVSVVSPAPDGGALLVSALRGWGIDALRRRLGYELLGVEAGAGTSV